MYLDIYIPTCSDVYFKVIYNGVIQCALKMNIIYFNLKNVGYRLTILMYDLLHNTNNIITVY